MPVAFGREAGSDIFNVNCSMTSVLQMAIQDVEEQHSGYQLKYHPLTVQVASPSREGSGPDSVLPRISMRSDNTLHVFEGMSHWVGADLSLSKTGLCEASRSHQSGMVQCSEYCMRSPAGKVRKISVILCRQCHTYPLRNCFKPKSKSIKQIMRIYMESHDVLQTVSL